MSCATRWLQPWCAAERVSKRSLTSSGMVRSPPRASTPNSTCHRLHKSPYLGREEPNEPGSTAGTRRGLFAIASFTRFPNGIRNIQLEGVAGLYRSTRILMAHPHPDDIGLDRRRFGSLRPPRTEDAPGARTLFLETPQSQCSGYRSAWTRPIAPPATPETPFVLARGGREALRGHL